MGLNPSPTNLADGRELAAGIKVPKLETRPASLSTSRLKGSVWTPAMMEIPGVGAELRTSE